jgi:hypothetical protein
VWGLALALVAGGLALLKQAEGDKAKNSKTPDQLRAEGVLLGRKQAADELKQKRKDEAKMRRIIEEQSGPRRYSRARPSRLDDDLDDGDDTPSPGDKPTGAVTP